MLDAVADRAAQVVGQGGTRPGGVGTIGDLACSHGIIEADLRVIGKDDPGVVSDGWVRLNGKLAAWQMANGRARGGTEGKAPEKTGAVHKLRQAGHRIRHSIIQ